MSVTIKELQERMRRDGHVFPPNPFTVMRENLQRRAQQNASLDQMPRVAQSVSSATNATSSKVVDNRQPRRGSDTTKDPVAKKPATMSGASAVSARITPSRTSAEQSKNSAESSAKDHTQKDKKTLQEEDPRYQPQVPTVFPTLADRYYQNRDDPTYQPLFNPVYNLRHSARTNSFLATAANMAHKEEVERLTAMARMEKMMTKPLAFHTITDDDGPTVGNVGRIDEASLLFERDFRPGYFENVFIHGLDENLKDLWDEVADDVEGVPFGPVPLGVVPGPNPCLKELNIPSFDLTALIAQYPTYLHRESALFYHFATPATQYQYRQLYTHNLRSLRSALAHAASTTYTLFRLLKSMNNFPAIQELHRQRRQEANDDGDHDNAEPSSHKSNTGARYTGEASIAEAASTEAGRRISRRSNRATNDMSDYTGALKDKHEKMSDLQAAENADAVRENYLNIEERMEDAFFWRELLILEVRMSEAALAKVDCAGTCVGILNRMYGVPQPMNVAGGQANPIDVEQTDGHGKGKGKEREVGTGQQAQGGWQALPMNPLQLQMQYHADMLQLHAAQYRWMMLGNVMRACWTKVLDRLLVAFEGKGQVVSSMGWRALRTRHAGELWDILENNRAMKKYLTADDVYWEGVARAAAGTKRDWSTMAAES